MTIRQWLTGLRTLGATLTLAVGAAGLWGHQNLSHALDEATATTRTAQTLMAGNLMHESLRGDVYQSLALAHRNEPDAQAQAIRDAQQHGQTLMRRVQALHRLTLPPAQKQLAEGIVAVAARYQAAGLDITQQATTDVDAASARLPHFVTLFQQLQTQQDQLIALVEAQAQADHEAAVQAQNHTLWWMLAATVLGSALLAGAATWVGRRVWSTLGAEPVALRQWLFRVAGGVENLRIPLAVGDDTSVLAGIAQMAERLRHTPKHHDTPPLGEWMQRLDEPPLPTSPAHRHPTVQNFRTEDHIA